MAVKTGHRGQHRAFVVTGGIFLQKERIFGRNSKFVRKVPFGMHEPSRKASRKTRNS